MSRWFAAAYDPFMRRTERACLRSWRRELLATASGAVLEIGAGTGANLGLYPSGVERLVLTDTDEHMLARLRRRHDLPARAGVVRASADALPFADASFDAVVSTLVLCSVPDVDRTLREIRRVLRAGGELFFLEHVGAEPGSSRRTWQRRVEPLWSRIAGNCHLTRATDEAITRAGFEMGSVERESMRKALPLVRPTVRGVARKA